MRSLRLEQYPLLNNVCLCYGDEKEVRAEQQSGLKARAGEERAILYSAQATSSSLIKRVVSTLRFTR